jgi:hypothetical protein
MHGWRDRALFLSLSLSRYLTLSLSLALNARLVRQGMSGEGQQGVEGLFTSERLLNSRQGAR